MIRSTGLWLHIPNLSPWPIPYIYQGPVHLGYSHWCPTGQHAGESRVAEDPRAEYKPCETKMKYPVFLAGLQLSAYRQQRQAQDAAQSTAIRRREKTMAETRPRQNACRGCGSHHHAGAGSGDRLRMCPSWGQMCRVCSKQNHFEMVCQLKGAEKRGAMRYLGDEEAAMDALIAHIVFDSATGTYKPGNSGLKELEAAIIPLSSCPDPRWIRDIPTAHPTRLKIFPDCGATICLGGLTYLRHLGLSERNLVPSKKKVYTVRGFSLVCQG